MNPTFKVTPTDPVEPSARHSGAVWLARPGLLFASGLLVNLFGTAMIALGVAGLTYAVRIDVTAPVIKTEGHMARLHRIKLASGWMLGASW